MSSFAVPLHRSIRVRLSLVVAIVIFAAVMSASIAGAFRDLGRAGDARAAMIEATGSAYSAGLAEPLASKDRRAALDVLRGMKDLGFVSYLAVEDETGEVLAQLGAGASLREATANLRSLAGLDLLHADHGSVSVPIARSGKPIGKLVVIVDLGDLQSDMFGTLIWAGLVALVAIGGAVAIVQFPVRRITGPLQELSAIMGKVGLKHDLTYRIAPTRRRDEAAALGRAFNGMIEHIQERDRAIARQLETLELTLEERTRELTLARRDAEAAKVAKSDFFATMHQEVRTPLKGMMAIAQMLASADLPERHRRYAEIIARSGASFLTTVNDFLDLDTIEAGQARLQAVPFSPEAIVEDVATLLWQEARCKNLDLAIRIAANVPQQVIGDPTRLARVIAHLVNNAVRFTEAGGVVIDLSAEPCGDRSRLRIAVRDTGAGIDAARIGALLTSTDPGLFGPTGLGLAVCKRLVDAMGGDMVATSEPGKGSVFTLVVTLPVETGAPAWPQASGLPIVVAVPSEVLAQSLIASLRDLGLSPRVIESPAMARPGEIVLTSSDLLARHGGISDAYAICLTQMGDLHADALARTGAAAELLPLPLGRQRLWAFLDRAARLEFAGGTALALEPAAPLPETFGRLRLLAVDDNAMSREMLREALRALGAEADFVTNGRQAAEAVLRKSYDVILVGGSMPDMDGVTATRLIRESETQGQKRAFILALDAQVRGPEAEAWAAAGADGHMMKPFTPARLAQAFSSIGQRVIASPSISSPLRTESAPATPLIDDQAIVTMEGVGARAGRDVVAKVWKLFLGQASDAVFRLEMFAGGSEAASLAKQARVLQSMALSAGAARLAGLCEEIARQASAGLIKTASEILPAVRPALEATCAEIAARLAMREAKSGA